MRIQIWKDSLFKGLHQSDTYLYPYVSMGRAFASYNSRRSNGIPVNDELAERVLGAVRSRCPFYGLPPSFSVVNQRGFTYRDDGGPSTFSLCTICGYSKSTPGSKVDCHPYGTYLETERNIAWITEASWDYEKNELTVASQESGVLIVYARNLWERSIARASPAFKDVELLDRRAHYELMKGCKERIAS